MGDLTVFLFTFKEKFMFKSNLIKSNYRVIRNNELNTYGAPVFACDYSTTDLAAKMCTNSNEHSMNIIFLWACATFLAVNVSSEAVFLVVCDPPMNEL
jgi:hypothetical protein